MNNRTDPREPDSREAKLPVWARETLEHLRRLLADADSHASKLRLDRPAESNTMLDPYIHEVALGMDPTIRFYLPDSSYVDARVRGTIVDLLGSEQVTLMPRSSNVVEVGIRRR